MHRTPWIPQFGWHGTRRAGAMSAPVIPTANLKIFLDGDDTDGSNNSTRTNGAAFNDWINKGALGGTFSNATGTQQPLFASSLLAGHAGATFDGVDDRLVSSLAASAFTFMHDGTGASVYVVARTSTSAAQMIAGTTIGNTGTNTGYGFLLNTTFRTFSLNSDGVTFKINLNSAINVFGSGTFNVLSSSMSTADTPDFTAYVNGAGVANVTPTAYSAGAPSQTMTVGANSTGLFPFNGNIVCLLVYNVAHDAAQRAAVEAALAAKYGVTFPA